MYNELLSIKSEIAEIKRILSEIPEENIIEKLSFQYRLEQVEEELRLFNINKLPEKISITFKGDPVHGIHGINADFAGKITDIFSEAFAAFVEVAKGIPLGSGGSIPEYDKHKLIITGTSVGSFGFELELPNPASTSTLPSIPEENPIQKARLMLEKVLEKTFEGDDDQLAESIECIDQRALDKINDFFETLQSHNATFSLKTKSNYIVCSEIEQIKYASGRLKKENIIEDFIEISGCFRGFLPVKRDFEFRTEDNIELKGKVDKSVQDSEKINTFLNKNVRVKFHTKKIGNGKPRYVLVSMNDICI